ncbi:O-antigen ligase family protein [Roseateles sp. SL47]|uniref:O-antigen ligase family protein n=1 Tax=Roseateles sp. SL47 TaxID=2995138 RepID=UPI002270D5CE|nr:O-antigen ligase family protein [Roseateles sp. SL47]WAC74310.1 O-antigen ligase family protein [Roseateles sp. SL47]
MLPFFIGVDTLDGHQPSRLPLIISVCGVIWFIPLSCSLLAPALTAHDFARLCQLGLLAVIALVLSLCKQQRHGSMSPAPSAFGIALAGLLTASALHATYPSIALRELLVFGGLLSLSVALSRCITTSSDFTPVLRTVVAGTFAHALIMQAFLLGSIPITEVVYPWEAFIGFDNPRFLNHAQTALLPLVAVVSVQDPKTFWRRLAAATLLLSGMVLFISLGRATMLALLVGLLVGLSLFRQAAGPYACRAAGYTLLGMLLMWLVYLLWLQPAGHRIDVQQLTQSHFRGYLFAKAFDLWKTSPWIGVGPMHFAHWYNGEAAHPHNIYSQILCEYGLIGAALIIGGALRWTATIFHAIRVAAPSQTNLAIGLAGSLVGVLVDGGLSGNFVMPISQLWIAVLVALCIAFHRLSVGPTPVLAVAPPNRPRYLRGVASAARVVFSLALIFLALQSAYVARHTPTPRLDTPGAVGMRADMDNANPRFWTVGWF